MIEQACNSLFDHRYIGSFYPTEHYNSGCVILRQVVSTTSIRHSELHSTPALWSVSWRT